MTFLSCFKKKSQARKAKRSHQKLLKAFAKIPEFKGDRLDRLMRLVALEDFSLFLEFLGLTVNEKLTILSSIDLLDDKKRIEAAKLQQQMRGLLFVYDIAEYLKTLVPVKEEDNDLE